MIQRRAARYTLNQYSYQSSVSAMLQHLSWPTLQQRRNLASVTMLYKLQHQLVSISNLHYLVPSRDHKFIQPFSPTIYHLYSFFSRTIRLWNLLPNQVANSSDLDTFTLKKNCTGQREARKFLWYFFFFPILGGGAHVNTSIEEISYTHYLSSFPVPYRYRYSSR